MNLENYLNDLVRDGYLKQEKIGLDQIKKLLQKSYQNLKAAYKIFSIAEEEAAFSVAYNAMIQLARALIYLKGYRPTDGSQHVTTITVAGEILGPEFKILIEGFSNMRRKRNELIYNPRHPLGIQEVRKALLTAKEFYVKVRQYLENIDPQLKLF